MIKLSIIIPTRNRAELLRAALTSLEKQTLDQSLFEVIICDNNSTDNTTEVSKSFADKFQNFRYVKTIIPGLHVGRNLGAQLTKGEISSYLDDDVIVDFGWAKEIVNLFEKDKDVVLAGGPCRPLWEGKKPEWLNRFIIKKQDRWQLGELSLIDLGEQSKTISAKDVFGCNFSIRKKVLLSLGGFHPDGMPDKLLMYRGDGESGLADVIDKNNMKVFYEPKIAVMHRVSQNRMTKKYFLGIAQRGAYSEVYTKYRSLYKTGFLPILKEVFFRSTRLISLLFKKLFKKNICIIKTSFTPEDYWFAAGLHSLFHFLRIFTSPKLKKWIVQSTYFGEDWCPYSEPKVVFGEKLKLKKTL